MSSNDGKQLLVFGLSFAQHDNRKMQQLLRHYDKLPDNPGSRANLFVQLNKVAKELMADEAAQDQVKQLTDWMTKGGDFPLGVAPAPTPASSSDQTPSAQVADVASRRTFTRGIPYLARRQGPGRTLNGRQITANQPSRYGAATQPPAANLGRQYGRGRTMDGDWEQNDDEEEEEDHYREDDWEGMGASMDEDDDMHDHVEGFPGMPRQGRFGDLQSGTPFYGHGHTLNDPQEEPGATAATAAVNEDAAAGSVDTEGQVMDEPQHHPGELVPGPFGHLDLRHRGEPLDEDHLQRLILEVEEYEFASFWRQDDHEAEPDNGQEIECPICLEDYPRSKFPNHRTITELCDHPDMACLSCLDSSISAIIERGALHLLACPICPQKLTRRNVKEYANPAVYKRYKYLKEQSEIPGHYISCTNPACGGSQPHESEDPMMICNHCQFATCAKHRRPWHEGQTCKEFDLDDAQIERLEEEEATAKLLSGEAMSICPKCGQGVTKTEGCDHMQCQCGQEWCYVVSKSPNPFILLCSC
jgi:hypothetical protein